MRVAMSAFAPASEPPPGRACLRTAGLEAERGGDARVHVGVREGAGGAER
jgi:hypothetical protein